MPIIPKVFIPIRSNDVNTRPFKAYKNYRIKRDDFNTGITGSAGHRRHVAHYKRFTPHIQSDTGLGVGNRVYEFNDEDNTNANVASPSFGSVADNTLIQTHSSSL